MTFDAHKNFAYSTVATAPSPATSGTSLTVATGDGTLFPAVPFNCTVWPAAVNATSGNAEIVRVTAIAGDVFTITRAQEGTAAASIAVGYQIADTITAKTLTDVEGVIDGRVVSLGDSTLGSDATFDFSSLSGSYAHLLVIAYLRSDNAATSDNPCVRFNNDSGNNYYDGVGAFASVGYGFDQDIAANRGRLTICSGATSPANIFSTLAFIVPHYANSTNKKSLVVMGFGILNITATNLYGGVGGVAWNSTAAINRVQLIPRVGTNFKTGSRMTIYGLGVS